MNSNRTRMVILSIIVFLTTGSPNNLCANSPQKPTPSYADMMEKNNSISLSKEEKKWLDNHQNIRISGPRAFPPFYYMGKDGDVRGIASDYMGLIAEIAGFNTSIIKNLPWPKVLESIKDHDIDLITCAAKTAERETFLNFTKPYLSFPMVIISRTNSPFIGGLNDLNGKKVACIKKVSTYEWLVRDRIKIIPYFVDTPRQALEAVSLGKADSFIGNLASVSYQIHTKGLSNLKIAAPTSYGQYKLFIAVRKDWPELVSIINKALAVISPKQHSSIRSKMISIRYEHGIRKADIIKWTLITIASVVLILGAVLLWYRRLNTEIIKRKFLENSLRLSERKLSTLLSNLPGMAYRCKNDSKWTMEFISDGVIELTGYEPGDFIDNREKAYCDIIHTDDQERVWSVIQDSLDLKKSFQLVYRIFTKNGTHKWVLEKGEGIFSPGGSLISLEGFITDISDRIKGEEELKRLQNLLSNIIDSMPSILIGVDIHMKVTQWNKQAEKDTGITAGAAMGKNLADMPSPLSGDIKFVRKAINEGEILKEPKTIHHFKDGTRMSDLTIYPLFSDEIEGAVIRLDDITEKVRMDEIIIQAEKMLSVGGLAAGMAHEINNPLGGILQNAQVAENRLTTNLPANQKVADELGISIESISAYMDKRGILEMLAAIKTSTQRAANIVSNVLSFSRKSESPTDLNDIGILLEETVMLLSNDYDLKSSYDFRHVRISREYAPNIPEIPCDASKIQQVFLNILKNGAHAMGEKTFQKGDGPHLILRTILNNNMVRIEIEDNGPGIEEKVERRVFEPFFTTKRVGSGTGLGLSVSYFIITENHGGTISVESTPGHGTKFIVELPLKPSATK